MRVALFGCLCSVACLPTKSVLVHCDTDTDCVAHGVGLRCNLTQHTCICDGTARFPGCDQFMDALPDGPVANGPEAGVGPDVQIAVDSTATPDAFADAASDMSTDAGADTGPACNGPTDCKDPARAFCVSNACVGCDQAGAGACAGLLCAPAGTANVGGQCVQCLTSATCSAATPICTANTCTACTTASQCLAKSPTTPACSASGACVQCTDNTTCSGATPVCDTTTNKCVQCLTSARCSGATPICTANTCAACTTASQCVAKSPTAPACLASGACVQCTDNTTCSGATPVCDTGTNKCVQCVSSVTCPASTPICTANVCTACTTAIQCAAKAPTTPACSASGTCVQCTDNTTCSGATPVCDTSINKCVQCVSSATCPAATPICAANVCTACTTAIQCAARNSATPSCASNGTCVQCTDNTSCLGATPICDTTTNKCVQCLTSAGCSGATPICTANLCTACTTASQCAAKTSTAPACASSGACVQCTDNTTCSGTSPICATSTNTCRGCTADSECSAIGPGVCMAHQDSRCASTGETVVVAAGGSLPSVASLSGKRLVVVRGTVSGSLTWTLAGLPQMTIVGQTTGTLSSIGSTATVHVTGGDLYIRNLSLTGGSPGFWADGGGTVRLDHVSVSNNTAGGILLDGVGFDIKNTTVSSNGANTAGAAAFGGIRIQNSLTTPKVLALSTISANQLLGVTCDASTSLSPSPTTVLVSGTTGVDIASVCGFTSCGTASTTCGAQP